MIKVIQLQWSIPKTTALLFDKLWIPIDFRHSQYGHDLGYDKGTLSVCVIEEIEESIKSANSMDWIQNALLTGKKISNNSILCEEL